MITGRLHVGHECGECSLSHLFKQEVWNMCPHGGVVLDAPRMSAMQMTHSRSSDASSASYSALASTVVHRFHFRSIRIALPSAAFAMRSLPSTSKGDPDGQLTIHLSLPWVTCLFMT